MGQNIWTKNDCREKNDNRFVQEKLIEIWTFIKRNCSSKTCGHLKKVRRASITLWNSKYKFTFPHEYEKSGAKPIDDSGLCFYVAGLCYSRFFGTFFRSNEWVFLNAFLGVKGGRIVPLLNSYSPIIYSHFRVINKHIIAWKNMLKQSAIGNSKFEPKSTARLYHPPISTAQMKIVSFGERMATTIVTIL